MSLHQLIAQGGTNIKSPVQRYMETKRQMGVEDQNRLAQMATRQQMGLREQQAGYAQKQDERAQQKFLQDSWTTFGKSVAPVYDGINQLSTPEEKNAAFKQSRPVIEQAVNRLPEQMRGNILSELDKGWNQSGTDAFLKQFMPEKEGKQINAVVGNGEPFGAIQNTKGQIVDPSTFKPIAGARKAPTEQRTGVLSDTPKAVRNKIEKDADLSEKNIYRAARNLKDIKKYIMSADYIGETSGDAVSIGNSLVAQIRQLSGNTGQLTEDDVKNPKGEYSRLRRAAQNNDLLASSTIEMAYIIAKMNDPGGRVTDADFKFAKNVITGSADRKGTLKKIDAYLSRSIDNYNMTERINSRKLGRKARLFTEEGYNQVYPTKAKADVPRETGVDSIRKKAYAGFGVN